MIADFALNPEAVAAGGNAVGKGGILDRLADVFARAYSLNAAMVREGLDEREKLGSTGFGRGVAIPHARIEGINRPIAALLRLDSPVDFNAADGMPVDLVFGLLSPVGSGAAHLHALAALSRLTRDEEMREALADAPDADALFALITNVADRDAA